MESVTNCFFSRKLTRLNIVFAPLDIYIYIHNFYLLYTFSYWSRWDEYFEVSCITFSFFHEERLANESSLPTLYRLCAPVKISLWRAWLAELCEGWEGVFFLVKGIGEGLR